MVATRFGYRVNRVVADLWGGHTAYDTAQSRPGPSALVAVVGPAANGAIALAGLAAGGPGPRRGARPAGRRGRVDQRLRRAVQPAARAAPGRRIPRRRPRLAGHRQPRPRPDRRRLVRSARSPSSCWPGRCCCRSCAATRPRCSPSSGPASSAPSCGAGATNAIRTGRARSALAGDHHRVRMAPRQLAAGGQQRGRRLGPAGQRARRHGRGRGRPTTARRSGLVDDDALLGHPRGGTTASPRSWPRSAGSPPGGSSTPSPTPPVTTVVETMQTLQVGAVPVRPRSGRIEGIVLAGDLEAALSRGAAART